MSNANRVRETTTATSVATVALGGAAAGFRTFAAGLPAGVKRTGLKVRVGPDSGGAWLIGAYDLTSDGTLTRRAILDSSANGADVTLASGPKEVELTFTAAQGDRIDNNTSVQVVYASSVLTSDSTLEMTPTLGANQTSKIQSLLDLATNGPLHLIWDVACTVDDIGTSQYACLLVSSNTTWEFLPNCGLVLRSGITKYMIMNKNATINPASRVDKNITFTGLAGVLHGNRDNQSVRGEALLAFYGVDGLYMNCPPEIRKAKQFSWRVANVYKVVVYKARVDFGSANKEQNTDGYHFNGPCSDIYVKDYTALNCGDDSLAFNADDAWGEGTFTGPFDNVYGPIDRVYVDGVFLGNFLFGIRLLSGASRIDNVTIKNVRGSTGAYSLVLDNYVSPNLAVSPGPGNFGKIFVDGIFTTNTSANATPSWTKMSVHLNCKIEQIKLLNIVKSDFNNENFPIVRIGEKAQIDQARIEFDSRNYGSGTYLTEQLDIAPSAKITQLDVDARVYASSTVSGYPIRVQAGATITQFNLDGQGINFTGMLNNAGTITNLHDRSFMDTLTAAPSTYTLQSTTNNNWREDTSNPSILSFVGVSPGVVASAKKKTADGFGGNVKLSSSIKFSGTTFQAGVHAALLVRGNALVPWNTAQAVYAVDIYMDQVGNGVQMFKIVGGTQTNISPLISNVLAVNETYACSLIAKGSAISTTIQRNSDGLYLQSNGTWTSTAGPCLTATDTSLPAASGEWGFYGYNENSPGISLQYTNIALTAAP